MGMLLLSSECEENNFIKCILLFYSLIYICVIQLAPLHPSPHHLKHIEVIDSISHFHLSKGMAKKSISYRNPQNKINLLDKSLLQNLSPLKITLSK